MLLELCGENAPVFVNPSEVSGIVGNSMNKSQSFLGMKNGCSYVICETSVALAKIISKHMK